MKKIVALSLVAMASWVGCKNNLAPPTDAPSAAQGQAQPPGQPAGVAPSSGSAGSIQGQLNVNPELAQHIKPGDTIFLIARDAQSNAMVAVTKLAAPAQFPLPFVLSSQNAMMGNTPFQGSVKLTARVDKDGDPMSKNPGDVIGEVDGATPIPSTNVVLTLNKVL